MGNDEPGQVSQVQTKVYPVMCSVQVDPWNGVISHRGAKKTTDKKVHTL